MATASSGLRSREQAAEYLGVQVQTLATWATTGRYDLPFIKVGRCVRYRIADLEDFLRRRTVNPAPGVAEQEITAAAY
jgi:excisionase family DNA binding protein